METNNRILVIDDDATIRLIYKKIFSPKTGNQVLGQGAALFGGAAPIKTVAAPVGSTAKAYEIFLAKDGQEGLELAEASVWEKRPFAVAFVDMMMPGIDGAETSQRLWEIDPKLKIVIVTAHSEFSIAETVRIIGRDDIFYLKKPFQAQEIHQFARALINSWDLEQERSRLAAELWQTNQELKAKVKQQTALAVQAEKMASIGILAAGVAHEINNPLAFIMGNLNTFQNYARDLTELYQRQQQLEEYLAITNQTMNQTEKRNWEQALQLAAVIKRYKEEHDTDFIIEDMANLIDESLAGTRRVAAIVSDLKTFARVDQNEASLINLHETIESTLNVINNELKYRVNKVVKDFGEIPEIKCFPQKISQVVLNLVMNGAQALADKQDGQSIITISTRYQTATDKNDDEQVVLTVTDNGCGIPEENLSKLFDPFFTTKPPGQGTGLGLGVVYEIVQLHQGEITVKSQPGQGSTFTVVLPVGDKIVDNG